MSIISSTSKVEQASKLEFIASIGAGEIPERIKRYKEKVLNAPFTVDIERLLWYTRVYKATEKLPIGPNVRTALAFRETVRRMTIYIDDDELIVGVWTGKRGSVPLAIEIFGPNERELMVPLLFRNNPEKIKEVFPEGIGSLGPQALIQMAKSLSDEEYKLLTEEVIPYWKEHSVAAILRKRLAKEGLLGEPVGKIISERTGDERYKHAPLFMSDALSETEIVGGTSPMQGHITIGMEKVLKLGFKGILEQAKERLLELWSIIPHDSDMFRKAKDFLVGVIIAAGAVKEYAERYARLAEEMASKTSNTQRRQELLEIAERMRHVPWEPPRDFIEALQAIWFTQVVMAIAHGGEMIIAPGRVDQYLYPFYKRDLERGKITPEKALELLEEYLLKTAQDIFFGPNNITIGGVDRKGNPAVNDISYLFLEALKRIKGGGRAGLAVRIAPNTPREFLLKAIEVYRVTGGIAIYNDAQIISDLMYDGYSLEDARDYSIVGCVEPTGTGNNSGYTSGQAVRLPSILEMTLFGGKLSMLGWKQVGPETPTKFEKFEDVLDAFKKQLDWTIDLVARETFIKDEIIAENFPATLISATIDDCIERARDITNGGAKYNHPAISAQSPATIADSLAAIKWAVFDRKIISMEELLNILRNNFKDAEEIRQILYHKAPKYGNDDPYADEVAAWVARTFDDLARKRRSYLNAPYRTNLISVSGSQIFEGKLIGATPDGRLAHTPVSTSINPNVAENGLTATLKSAALLSKVGHQTAGTSLVLNVNPSLIKDEEGLDKFASLIEAAFAMGLRMVQFNPISKEVLLDAQMHPEKYPDLVVKVSGYSFRFIDLPKAIQDEIIARLEYEGL